MTAIAILLGAGTVGLIVGSFVATAALRKLDDRAFLFGRSACDHCGAPLGYASTLPLLSFAHARGVSRCCATPIEPLHLWGELAGLGVGLAAALQPDLTRAALVFTLGFVLLAASVIDAKTQRLPDGLTVTTLALSAILTWCDGVGRLLGGILAGLITFVLIEGLRRAFLHFKGREGLGFGDVKLFAALAIWLGELAPLALSLAALAGLGYVVLTRLNNAPNQTTRIAFGPALAGATFLIGALAQPLGLGALV